MAYLLLFKDVMVEVLLQLLIGQVNAELLKVVGRKLLKAVDVQHAYAGCTVLVLSDSSIDAKYQPVKHLCIDDLSQGITSLACCLQ